MEIKRSGSPPSGQAPAEYLAGKARVGAHSRREVLMAGTALGAGSR
jgi:hypothetical protein